jgi:hypothetical protein
VDTLTWIHSSWSHSFSVTIVFYSDELIRSPDDDPKGSKHVVTIKNYVKHTPVSLILFIVVLTVRNLYIPLNNPYILIFPGILIHFFILHSVCKYKCYLRRGRQEMCTNFSREMSYDLFSCLIYEYILDLKFFKGLQVLQLAQSLGLNGGGDCLPQ